MGPRAGSSSLWEVTPWFSLAATISVPFKLSTSNRHYAIDYRSSKGVVVNGNKITGEQPLADGDVIQIGGTTIVYSVEDSPDAQRVMDQLRKLGEGGEPTIIPDPR